MKTINILTLYPKYGIISILDIARGFKNLGTLNKRYSGILKAVIFNF